MIYEKPFLLKKGVWPAYTNNCLYKMNQIFISGWRNIEWLRKWFLYPCCLKYNVIFNGEIWATYKTTQSFIVILQHVIQTNNFLQVLQDKKIYIGKFENLFKNTYENVSFEANFLVNELDIRVATWLSSGKDFPPGLQVAVFLLCAHICSHGLFLVCAHIESMQVLWSFFL